MSKRHRCPHGLDLRLHPRCYLCDPEPRPIVLPGSLPTWAPTFEVRCTCPVLRPGEYYVGDVMCQVHNPLTTYTSDTNTWQA